MCFFKAEKYKKHAKNKKLRVLTYDFWLLVYKSLNKNQSKHPLSLLSIK